MFDDKVLFLSSNPCSELHPVPTINICSVNPTVEYSVPFQVQKQKDIMNMSLQLFVEGGTF